MSLFQSEPNPKRKPRIQKKLDKQDKEWREVESCMMQELGWGSYHDDDDDWEEMGGIDPALAPHHDFDHDPVGFR